MKPYLNALDAFLLEQVEAFEPEIQGHVRYVLGHSGKRLRPMLVAYSGWEGGGERAGKLGTSWCGDRIGAFITLV